MDTFSDFMIDLLLVSMFHAMENTIIERKDVVVIHRIFKAPYTLPAFNSFLLSAYVYRIMTFSKCIL